MWNLLRLRRKAPHELPRRLRLMPEQPGTTFVKLGQGLSLRRDVLPAGDREELKRLQSRFPPFVPDLAIAAIEAAFGQPVKTLFADSNGCPLLQRRWPRCIAHACTMAANQ